MKQSIAGASYQLIRQMAGKCVVSRLPRGCSTSTTVPRLSARTTVRASARSTSSTTPPSAGRCSVPLDNKVSGFSSFLNLHNPRCKSGVITLPTASRSAPSTGGENPPRRLTPPPLPRRGIFFSFLSAQIPRLWRGARRAGRVNCREFIFPPLNTIVIASVAWRSR